MDRYICRYLTTVRVGRRINKRRRIKGRLRKQGKNIACHAVMVFAAASKLSPIKAFDIDSGQVGIDNRA